MNRNELNRLRTIEDIKESFIELYEAGGIDKVSVQNLCGKANISKTIFYRYFDDKYQVLESIEEELLDGLRKANIALKTTSLSEYKKGQPFPVFFETAQYVYSKKQYFKSLLSAHGDPQFIFKWKKQIRLDVRTKFEHDQITGYNLDVVTELFAASVIGLYTYWFFENPEMSCQEISEIGGNMLCGSFYNFRN